MATTSLWFLMLKKFPPTTTERDIEELLLSARKALKDLQAEPVGAWKIAIATLLHDAFQDIGQAIFSDRKVLENGLMLAQAFDEMSAELRDIM